MQQLKKILKQLGPGLLFAGAAIGVSHMVQSTRAGALYGFDLLWAVIVIHIVKYPFFHYGPRYVAATGENLLDGYKRLGAWAVVVFVVFTIGTVFTVQAAVTVVTASIFANLFHITIPIWQISAFILLGCGILLFAEKFFLLDRSIKYIISLLTISTIVAVFAGVSSGYHPPEPVHFEWGPVGIAFLIALMGWMPSPLDLAVWVSFWNQEKNLQLKTRLTIRQTLRDFNIGYWGTLVIAVFFLSLGALVMHGKGLEFSPKGAVFAGQVIDLYTETLGSWAHWIIGIAALTTMVSTTLTVFDAIPRTLEKTTSLLKPSFEAHKKLLYRIYMVILAVGAIALLALFIENMQTMVDLATILSFCTTPFFAIANYLVIRGKHVPREFRPGKILNFLSWFGIVFLVGFVLIYLFKDEILLIFGKYL